MEHDDPFRVEEHAGASSSTLPVIALVLGALSIPGSVMLGLGIVPGLIGLIIGILAVRNTRGSGMALLGIILSMFGIVMSAGMVGLMFWGFREVSNMTVELAEDQLAMNKAWEGVRAPVLRVQPDQGRELSTRERNGRKLLVYQFFPVGPPLNEEAPVDVVNRLARAAGEDFDVLVLMQMPGASAAQAAGEEGVTAPIAGSTSLPEPFALMSIAAFYFVIDRNGVIQHTFDSTASYEQLIEALLGADFEGAVLENPDFSKVETTYYPVPVTDLNVAPELVTEAN